MPKNPFVSAAKTEETYIYPHPLDPKEDVKLIDAEVLQGEDGKPLPAEQVPWIKVRIPRSAADVDACADYTQAVALVGTGGGVGYENRVARMNRGLFDLLVEDWSFMERTPTVEDYDKLDQWAAVWVRNAVADAHRQGTAVDFSVPTPSSSDSAETSRGGSRRGSRSE